jgi:GT2 family glycosyltransferase
MMPGCRFTIGDGHHAMRHRADGWLPIPLVAVDIDTAHSVPGGAHDGQRIWIEAMRKGLVVGLLETRSGPDGLAQVTLGELAAAFPDEPEEPVSADDDLPRASVVVPTVCSDRRQLGQTIDSLLALDYPDYEVIVVDNRVGASHGGIDGLPVDDRLQTTAERRPGISAARNQGVRVSTGGIVAFTDDDATVDKNWLRALGSRFVVDPDVEAVGGLVLPGELETEPQLWFEEFYGGFTRSFRPELLSLERHQDVDPLFPYAPARFGAGCNMAFRREALERTGGFITTLGTGTPARGGEDLAMFIQLVTAGATVAFEPAAVVRHTHRRTEREFLRQVFAYGTGLTAMFTAIALRDPSHVRAVLRRIPSGIRQLGPQEGRSPSRNPSYPRRAFAYQLLGMLNGPVAYARSAAMDRWSP